MFNEYFCGTRVCYSTRVPGTVYTGTVPGTILRVVRVLVRGIKCGIRCLRIIRIPATSTNGVLEKSSASFVISLAGHLSMIREVRV